MSRNVISILKKGLLGENQFINLIKIIEKSQQLDVTYRTRIIV